MSKMDITDLQTIVKQHLERKGVSKKFVGTIYSNVEDMNQILAYFSDIYKDKTDYIVALDGSGFILGSMLARELGIGFIPIAKDKESGLLEDEYRRFVYINHQNKPCALAVRKDSIPAHSRILIVDNWIETGATVRGIMSVMEDSDAEVVGIVTFGMDDNEKTQSLKEDTTISSIL